MSNRGHATSTDTIRSHAGTCSSRLRHAGGTLRNLVPHTGTQLLHVPWAGSARAVSL